MPGENLALARRFFDLAREKNWSRLDLLSKDVVYRPIRETTEAGEYRGREEFRAYMESFFTGDWAEDLEIAEVTFREYPRAVVARAVARGQGRASGLEFEVRVFAVLTIREGQIVRVEDFLDRGEALVAAGAEP